jgi:hypothetical protein
MWLQFRLKATLIQGRAMTKRGLVSVLAATVLWSSGTGPLQGGNPLQTNDPETPGPNGWEINLSHNMRFSHPSFAQFLPLININYGWLENDQWKISVPVLEIDPHPGREHWGIGDIQLGWKYRFLDEDEHGVQASIYPQPLLPTGDASLGLGNDRFELLFPMEVGKYFCDDRLFLYGEIGPNFVFDGSEQHSWFVGAAAEYRVTKKIELVSEIVHIAFPHNNGIDDLFFNAGVNVQLSKHVVLQTAFGRSLFDQATGVPFFNSYIGLHITWGGDEDDESDGEDRRPEAGVSSLFRRALRR